MSRPKTIDAADPVASLRDAAGLTHVNGARYRVSAGAGPRFGDIPVEVALVTHAAEDGRPLTWAPTNNEATRRAAIVSL